MKTAFINEGDQVFIVYQEVKTLGKMDVEGNTISSADFWAGKEAIGGITDDDEYENIDAEYAHKKYESKWCKTWQETYLVTDLCAINVVNIVQVDTGSDYITCPYVVGNVNAVTSQSIYVYERYQFIMDTMRKTFQELGMESAPNANYSSTDKKKIYNLNGTSSVAFGTYFLNDECKQKMNVKTSSSTLDKVTEMMKKDEEFFTQYIKNHYNRHFGSHLTADKITLAKIISELNTIHRFVNEIDAKRNTEVSQRCAKSAIVKLEKEIQEVLNKLMEESK